MRGLECAAFGVALAWVAMTRPVLAAPVAEPDAGVQLQWTAPPECADETQVRRQIEARVRPGEGRAVRAKGVVARTPSGELTLDLEIDGDARHLDASSCAALAEAAGLLIAIAADPAAARRPPRFDDDPTTQAPASSEPSRELPPDDETVPEPSPRSDSPATATSNAAPAQVEPSPPPRPSEAPSNVVDATPPPLRRSRRVGALVRIDGVAQIFRVLPRRVGGAVSGTVGLSLPSARVESRGRYVAGQVARYADRPEIGGRIDLWTLGVAGCWAPRAGSIEVPVCGGVEAGSMRARSFGLSDDGRARSAWLALPFDASVVWAPIPWLGLRAGAELAVALRRPRFHVRDLPPLFRAGPAALRLVVGIEARFP